MAIRMIVMDMDDTLLTHDRRVTERTLDALNEAKRRGAYIVLASGRMTESMLDVARLVDVNAPLIAYNGGAIYDSKSGRYTHENTVSLDVAREVSLLAEEHRLYIQGYWGGEYYFDREIDYSRAYANSIGKQGIALNQPLSGCMEQDPFKLLMIDEPDRIAQFLPLLQQRFKGRLSCVTSKPIYIECTAPNADKGEALHVLALDLGIARDEILAFGDGGNDLGMLQYAGFGYAMGNASEHVRNKAKHVAPSNDEDGLAQVVEQLLARGEIVS
ncbi:Cof-type HAD-IIB family hydrolase [Eubacteriales bacterium OttesenSCG-928-N13]|nr:Cof-type HAD-IIB family hydrolase [Eubacteriales bacterium OttesenSCG-928-N13]